MGNKSQLRYPLLAGCEQFWDKPVGQNPEAEPVGQTRRSNPWGKPRASQAPCMRRAALIRETADGYGLSYLNATGEAALLIWTGKCTLRY